jgi:hypothetical protein
LATENNQQQLPHFLFFQLQSGGQFPKHFLRWKYKSQPVFNIRFGTVVAAAPGVLLFGFWLLAFALLFLSASGAGRIYKQTICLFHRPS